MANEVKIPIEAEFDAAIQSVRRFGRTLDQVSGRATKDFNKMTSASSVFFGTLSSQAVYSAAVNGFRSMSDAIRGFISEAQRIDDYRTQFRILLGSAEEAEKTIRRLQKFAATTPFEIPSISNATKQLISFGVSANDVFRELGKLGDIASVVGADIDDLAIPYGRLISTQKLTLIELDKFADRGVNLYKALADEADVSLRRIREQISKGKVPFEAFTRVIEKLTSEGGAFFRGMEIQSATLTGRLSNLSDSIQTFQASFGAAFTPALTEQARILSDSFNNLTNTVIANRVGLQQYASTVINFLGTAAVKFVDFFKDSIDFIFENKALIEGLVTGLVAAATSYGTLSAAIAIYNSDITTSSVLTTAFNILLSGDEVSLYSLAIGTATAAFIQYNDGIARSIGVMQRFAGEVITSIAGPVETVASSLAKIVGIFNESLAQSIRDASSALSDYGLNLQETGNKQIEFAEKTNAAAAAARSKANAVVESNEVENESNRAKEAEEARRREEAEERRRADEEFAREERERKKIEEEIETDERLQRNADALGRQQAIENEYQARNLEREGKFLEAKRKRREADRKASEKNIFGQKKFEDRTNQERIQGTKTTLGTIATLQQSSSSTLFGIGKAAALALHVIRTAEAISLAMSTLPPPFNYAAATAVGLAMLEQGRRIASAKPPSAGGYAEGGIVPGSSYTGDRLIASVNSREMILNQEQQKNLFEAIATNDFDRVGGGGTQVSVNIEGGFIANEQGIDELIEAFNDRLEFGNRQLRGV